MLNNILTISNVTKNELQLNKCFNNFKSNQERGYKFNTSEQIFELFQIQPRARLQLNNIIVISNLTKNEVTSEQNILL